MRLLYLSCHETLEFDEVSLFHEMGVEVFPIGAYLNRTDNVIRTNNEVLPGLRPGIPGFNVNKEDFAAYHKCVGEKIEEASKNPLLSGKVLTKEFVDRFDIIMIMHVPVWFHANWNIMKHKTVVWRTIGQSIHHNESELIACREEGMKIVRYSPMEANIPGYLGADAVIRFYKDQEEFSGWTGEDNKIIAICQSMKTRGEFCNFRMFDSTTKYFVRNLYGTSNDNTDIVGGVLPYGELKKEIRSARVYFYTGTQPASYTLNFMEAMMTGIPITAIGPKHANSLFNHDLYEIPKILDNETNGYWSDNVNELRSYITALLSDDDLAKKIGENGRKRAIELFGKEKIKEQWQSFFDRMVGKVKDEEEKT